MDSFVSGTHEESTPQIDLNTFRLVSKSVESLTQLKPVLRQPIEIYSDQIVATFEDLGFRAAFGIPGGAVCTIFNSLSRSQQIRIHLAQHECGAAYMAMGRSLVSQGKEMGLCFGTSGPGITNMITGVAAAFEERVPIFVVTGNVASTLRGRGAAQDAFDTGIDAVRMLDPITARSVTVLDPVELVPTILDLFELAEQSKRPVHLNVPVDIASRRISPVNVGRKTIAQTNAIDITEIERAVSAFITSERPLIFAGHGAKISGNGALLRETIESLDIPLVITSHAKGIISEDHSNFFGTFGFAATQESTRFIEEYRPTAILFLGTRLSEPSSAGWSPLLNAPEIRIHVDLDETQLNRIYKVTHPVRADIGTFLRTLKAAPRIAAGPCDSVTSAMERHRQARQEGRPRTDEIPLLSGPADPVSLMSVLDLYLPDDVVLFSDIGNTMAWVIHHLRIREGQDFYLPLGLGSMGSGICAAIGAATGISNRPVVCLTGDCSALMHGTELFTAVNAGLPIKLLVLNDGGHGMVDHGHRILGLKDAQVRFKRHIDFEKFGQALGVRSYSASSLSDLVKLPLDEIFRSSESALIDVRVNPEKTPPILARTRVLGQADRSAQ